MASRQASQTPSAPGMGGGCVGRSLGIFHILDLRPQGYLDWGWIVRVLKRSVLGPGGPPGLQSGHGAGIWRLA